MPTSALVASLQPSQLYIDADRLQGVLEWYDVEASTRQPLPVLELDDDLVLPDGHTRAFVAHLTGAESIEVVPDPDRTQLNLDLYRECVGWCRAESVTQIGDLVGRVVSRETFLHRWVDRCEASPHHASA